AEEDLGAQVSAAIDDADFDEAECLLPDDVVAEAAGDDVTESSGTGGGSGGGSGDLEYSYSYAGCDFTLAGGLVLTVAELIDTNDSTVVEGFEQVAALVAVDDDVVPVEGLGDEAVQNDEELLVRVGDRAFLVEGEDDAGGDADPEVLAAVAEALLAEIG
ncbi:MAG: hypothetical protein H0W25_15240, partial [Acidimicrobiia bacterium]|nr:hypothetical protein [Acidimicrobiia bacterium]